MAERSNANAKEPAQTNAQSQHYVPKFILRNFLSDAKKEHVKVYDRDKNSTFTTSIHNVMTERRFNDFSFQGQIISLEPILCEIEDLVLPVYREIIKSRKLENSEQEKSSLALFFAFQLARARSFRNQYKQLIGKMEEFVIKSGANLEQIQGWELLTEEKLKAESLRILPSMMKSSTSAFLTKTFTLSSAPSGRSFYLGDNPVSMYNAHNYGPYGNIGLMVKGVEIHMPLSSDLLLSAWCPTTVHEIRQRSAMSEEQANQEGLRRVAAGQLSLSDYKKFAASISRNPASEQFTHAVDSGERLLADDENMDFFNWLQVSHAARFVVCSRGDFALAKKFNAQHPGARNGRTLVT